MLIWKGHKKHRNLQWIHLTHFQKAWFSVVKPYAHHLHLLIGFVNDYIDAGLERTQKTQGFTMNSPHAFAKSMIFGSETIRSPPPPTYRILWWLHRCWFRTPFRTPRDPPSLPPGPPQTIENHKTLWKTNEQLRILKKTMKTKKTRHFWGLCGSTPSFLLT